jgi:rhodanese-related sulfurtransferase
VARILMDEGFTVVRPLAGGFDAWIRAGYPLDALGEIES